MRLLLLLALLPLCAAAKPNFIIIFTDDQGYNDLGSFGSETIRTPHLDRMAKEGLPAHELHGAQPGLHPFSRRTPDRLLPEADQHAPGSHLPHQQTGAEPGGAHHRRPTEVRRLRHRLHRQVAPRSLPGGAPPRPRLRQLLRDPLLERHEPPRPTRGSRVRRATNRGSTRTARRRPG